MPLFLLLLAIVLSPLALGAVDLPAKILLQAMGLGAAFLCLVHPTRRPGLLRVPGLLPLLLFLGFLLVQTIPLPTGLLQFLSPATFILYEKTIGLAEMPAWLTLSLAPQSTLKEFFRFAAYGFFYILTIQLLSDRDRLRRSVYWVVGLAALIALQAILQKAFDNGRLLWLWPAPAGTEYVGPFIYHNHFAGYAEMVAGLALGLFLYLRQQSGRTTGPLRQRLAAFLARPRLNLFLLAGLALLLLLVAMVVSMSRGGMLSLAVALVVLFVILARRERFTATGIGAIVLLLCVLIVGWVGGAVADREFGAMFDAQGNLADGRLQVWRDALLMVRDFPLFGTGFGTFGHIYPTYRTIIGGKFYYNAHNDILELFTDTGLIGFSLMGWFVLAAVRAALVKGRKRRDPLARYISLGALTGVLALLLHSLVDFNFQSGANGLYFFFLLGLAVAAAHVESRGQASRLPVVTGRGWRPAGAILAGLLLVAGAVMHYGMWRAGQAVAAMDAAGPDSETPPAQVEALAADLAASLRLAPLDSLAAFRLAQAQDLLGNKAEAARFFQRAIRLNPAQATFHYFYGLFLSRQGDLDRADGFMRASVRYGAYDPSRRLFYAIWLVQNKGHQEAGAEFGRMLAMAPADAAGGIQIMAAMGLSDDEISASLPDRVQPHLAFAAHLREKGEKEDAAEAYQAALSHLDREPTITAAFFWPAHDFFVKEKRNDDALAVLRQAVARLPGDTRLRAALEKMRTED